MVNRWSKLEPASEASREVANLTERKNQHSPVCGVKEFVCLLPAELLEFVGVTRVWINNSCLY